MIPGANPGGPTKVKKYINQFWNWYGDNLHINIGIAAVLFAWQLLHLGWLSLDVVLERILDVNIITLSSLWEYLIVIVDYTEIPAIITVSLIYINELRRGFNARSIWFLVLLNSQWLHLLWITDEFVVDLFRETSGVMLSVWLAWIAIFIDYLELPVMYDTIKKFMNQRSHS